MRRNRACRMNALGEAHNGVNDSYYDITMSFALHNDPGEIGDAQVGRPLTSSVDGFLLFSVPAQLKGLGQLERGFLQRQALHGRPEVEHVPVSATVGVKALKDILAQVGGEG